ncbi:MAG: hypothetical protein ACFFAY_10545 [Promethearchaeota archaeon]
MIPIVAAASLILLGSFSVYQSQELVMTTRIECRETAFLWHRTIIMNLNSSVPNQTLTIDFDYFELSHFNITGAPVSIVIVNSSGSVIINYSMVSGDLVSGIIHDSNGSYNITIDSGGLDSTITFVSFAYCICGYAYHEVTYWELKPQSSMQLDLGLFAIMVAVVLLVSLLFDHFILLRRTSTRTRLTWMK